MIIKGRMTAKIEGNFAIFLIGMRFNKFWAIHKWFPVLLAMPKMLRELYAKKELGLLHHEIWFGRTTILIQYWQSKEQLLTYARNREAQHLPAWRKFNRAIGSDGSVGIWHETYLASSGTYENIYVNMPQFGLGKAGKISSVGKEKESASQSLEF